MAKIAPFKGIRYSEPAVGDLDKVVSPPYDIISPEDRVYYHKLHPNNFVRLILGEEFEGDTERENRFTRARQYLEAWLAEGVLVESPEPAIYVYEQQFERQGVPGKVRGFICAVKLHEYSEKVILPHENTLAKPKSQLGELIRQTRANLDCIYGLYGDEAGALDDVMDRAMNRPADAEARDRDGVRHAVWVVSDSREISAVQAFVSDRPIAIADGHHRYETALAYRNEVREKSSCCACCELPSDYTLMTIVNVYQKDMTIFPTHRVVGKLPEESLSGLEERLGELFEVAESSRESILDDMAQRGAIGTYGAGGAKTLRLREDPGALIEGSEASRKLELNVLHRLVLERALGIDQEKLRNQTHIIYTRSAGEAMDLVDSGERQVAFLLNHIDVKSVLDIASAGEKMPQKATYFYPKLLSGLVLRKME